MTNLNFTIEATCPQDTEAILAMSQHRFGGEDIILLEESLNKYFTLGAEKSGYYFLTCHGGGQSIGFVGYRAHPLTMGTFDLIWLAADEPPVGQAMLERLTQKVKNLAGRLIIAETASARPDYDLMRQLYETHHYKCEMTIADFYAPGNDLLIYVQRL